MLVLERNGVVMSGEVVDIGGEEVGAIEVGTSLDAEGNWEWSNLRGSEFKLRSVVDKVN